MIKDNEKLLLFVLISLMTAILIYPFLHECGHYLVALVLKGKVIEFRILPTPYVLCDLSKNSNLERTAIGMAGNWFPIIISMILPANNYVLKVFRIILKIISVFATVISFISVRFLCNEQDDFFQIIRYWEYSKVSLVFIAAGSLMFSAYLLICEHPVKWLRTSFEI